MSVTAAKARATRKWVVLGTALAAMVAGAMAFGETPTPCYEAYVMSGLTEPQMSFEDFAERYHDNLCASEHREA